MKHYPLSHKIPECLKVQAKTTIAFYEIIIYMFGRFNDENTRGEIPIVGLNIIMDG